MANSYIVVKSMKLLQEHSCLHEIDADLYLEMANAAGVSCSDLNSDIVEKMVEDCKGFITSRLHPVLKGKVLECLII